MCRFLLRILFMLHGSRWITLKYADNGSLIRTKNGIYAVKSENYMTNGQCECILLNSGEYAHFPSGNKELVQELFL
jgi:hypothetical protein